MLTSSIQPGRARAAADTFVLPSYFVSVASLAARADPTWTPLVNTPADPSYPGAHSALAAAGAEVLEAVFGRDIPITVTSAAVAGATRSYRHASDAAAEAGISRLWGGIHWRFDDPAGAKQGRAVARFVTARSLRTN